MAQLQALPPAQTGTAQHEGPSLEEHPFCPSVCPSITISREETGKPQSPSWGQAAFSFQNGSHLLRWGLLRRSNSQPVFGSPSFLLPLPPQSTPTDCVCSHGAASQPCQLPASPVVPAWGTRCAYRSPTGQRGRVLGSSSADGGEGARGNSAARCCVWWSPSSPVSRPGETRAMCFLCADRRGAGHRSHGAAHLCAFQPSPMTTFKASEGNRR